MCYMGMDRDGVEARAALGIGLIIFTLLTYTGLVIPLSFDSMGKPDIAVGQGQYLNSSGENSDTALVDHPYYGLFVTDLILM